MVARCRICGSRDLEPVLDLGNQALTGIFQKDGGRVPKAPLELVLCMGECGLLQLKHSVPRKRLFGPTYGYESGINQTMREHLQRVAGNAWDLASPKVGDIVLDIGSNDGTLLSGYSSIFERIGIDPSGAKFKENYHYKKLVIGYFNRRTFRRKAKIITSIAMFYDLDDPLAFMRDIKRSLAPDGVWVTEQSYMPMMLRNVSYDTVCHEHLEYYGLRQIMWMAWKVGLRVIDVTLNDINGGSFCVTLCHRQAPYRHDAAAVKELVEQERELELDDYRMLAQCAEVKKRWLLEVLDGLRDKLVLGYGASTKGNVILQYCGIQLKAIADRNPAKWGLRTPGTNIPIISEEKARAMKPDAFLVLPWHFAPEIRERERAFTDAGGQLIFPLGGS